MAMQNYQQNLLMQILIFLIEILIPIMDFMAYTFPILCFTNIMLS